MGLGGRDQDHHRAAALLGTNVALKRSLRAERVLAVLCLDHPFPLIEATTLSMYDVSERSAPSATNLVGQEHQYLQIGLSNGISGPGLDAIVPNHFER
jgi:hypothetical protein